MIFLPFEISDALLLYSLFFTFLPLAALLDTTQPETEGAGKRGSWHHRHGLTLKSLRMKDEDYMIDECGVCPADSTGSNTIH
jgi:hypothetical protein